MVVGIQIGTATREQYAHFLKKLKTELPNNSAILLLSIYVQRKWKQDIEEIHAFPCLLQYYSQQSRYRNNLKCPSMNE